MPASRSRSIDGLVFTNLTGGPLHPANVYARFKALAKQAGLPATVRLHDLRHGWASTAIETGTPIKIVSETLGHSNINITLDTYSHLDPKVQRQAITEIGDAIFATRKG